MEDCISNYIVINSINAIKVKDKHNIKIRMVLQLSKNIPNNIITFLNATTGRFYQNVNKLTSEGYKHL